MVPCPSETFSLRLLAWVTRATYVLVLLLLPVWDSEPAREVPTRLPPSIASEAGKDIWNPCSQQQNYLVFPVVSCWVKQLTNLGTKIAYLHTEPEHWGWKPQLSVCDSRTLPVHCPHWQHVTFQGSSCSNGLFITGTSQRLIYSSTESINRYQRIKGQFSAKLFSSQYL